VTTTAQLHSGSDPDPDPDSYKQAFRRYPAGVVVITLDSGVGPVGFTATSLTSLSLDPPLVSFGISSNASTWAHLRQASTAVVNFLGAHQEQVARRFATSGIDRFAEPTRWQRLATGEPVLDDVPGWLRTRVESLIPAGDHRIVVAHVVTATLSARHPPLIYHDGHYASVGRHRPPDIDGRHYD
jgi:flavin reductase (DIM6/NTAB) family NADH-FMN oxidoreductase RutF